MNVKIKILSIALIIAVLGIVTVIASAQDQSNATNVSTAQNQQEILTTLNRIQNQSNVSDLSIMLVQNQRATTNVLNKIFILLMVISVLLALSLLLSHLSFLKERLQRKKIKGALQPNGFEIQDVLKNERVSTIKDIKGDIDNIIERLNKLEGQGKQEKEEYKVEGEREIEKGFREAPPRPKPGDIRRGKKGDIL